jgi:hypothetical protein
MLRSMLRSWTPSPTTASSSWVGHSVSRRSSSSSSSPQKMRALWRSGSQMIRGRVWGLRAQRQSKAGTYCGKASDMSAFAGARAESGKIRLSKALSWRPVIPQQG